MANTSCANVPRRPEGTFVTCPFVYGSVAFFMGKKADSYASHKWSLFIRGPSFEDLSCFVSRVVFTLHPSFAVPIREVLEPPYQVSEYGWGEFEAGIRIVFRDPNEQPIDLIHQIRLYPPVLDPATPVEPQNPKVPVVAESYDEVVFTNPTETFKRLLMMYSVSQTDVNTLDSAIGMEHYTKYCDDDDLQQLASVQDVLSREMDQAKTRLLQIESDLNTILSDPLCLLKPPPDVPESAGADGTNSCSSSSSVTAAVVGRGGAAAAGDTKGSASKAAIGGVEGKSGATKAMKAPCKPVAKKAAKASTTNASGGASEAVYLKS